MSLSDDHFARLREDEQQQRLERQAEAATGADHLADDDQPRYEDGQQPGHLGNDTSNMPLLQTDLEKVAREGYGDRERNPEVQDALQKLDDLDIPNPSLEANGALDEPGDSRRSADVEGDEGR